MSAKQPGQRLIEVSAEISADFEFLINDKVKAS